MSDQKWEPQKRAHSLARFIGTVKLASESENDKLPYGRRSSAACCRELQIPEYNPPSEQIKAILEKHKTVAIVGLSPKPERDSYKVAKYLKENHYRIVPVNPGQKEILGDTCYPNLKAIPFPVDVVDIFRRPEAIPPVVDDAIEIGAKVVWMQVGLAHNQAANKAQNAGLEVVMNKCMKIEHMNMLK